LFCEQDMANAHHKSKSSAMLLCSLRVGFVKQIGISRYFGELALEMLEIYSAPDLTLANFEHQNVARVLHPVTLAVIINQMNGVNQQS